MGRNDSSVGWINSRLSGGRPTDYRREFLLVVGRGSWVRSRGSWVASRGSWVPSRGSWVPSRGSWVVGRGLLIGRDLH